MLRVLLHVLLGVAVVSGCKTSSKGDLADVKAVPGGGCRASSPTSEDRLECTWQKIRESNYGRDDMPALRNPALTEAKDVALPHLNTRSFKGGEEVVGRQKVIHRYGVVGKVRFVADPAANHNYTGIFRTGSDFGLVRLSLAVKPSEFLRDTSNIPTAALRALADAERTAATQTPLVNNFTPGMAFKIYVPNKEGNRSESSVNMHVMYSVDGQESINFFEQSFSNVLPAPASLKAKLGAHFFRDGMERIGAQDTNPGHLTVDHFGAVDGNGDSVASSRAPYKIEFRPDAGITQTYKELMVEQVPRFWGLGVKDKDAEFRRVLTDPQFWTGDVLFTVWGQGSNDDPGQGTPFKKIGTLVLDSSFVASKYGDETLHFAHHTK